MRWLPFILRNVLRNRRRTLFTALSIAACFTLLGVLMAMYRMFFLTGATPSQALRLIVRHRVSITNFLPASYGDRIRRTPGVVELANLLWFGGTYKDEREMKNFFARFAVDPEPHLRIYSEYRLPENEKQAYLRERNSCIVGRALADRLGFKTGDHIHIKGDIFPINLDLVLRGIYDSPRDVENLFFHYKYLAEAVQWKDFAGLYVVLVDSPESVPRVAQQIDASFRNSTAPTKTETERAFELSFLSYLGNVKLFLLAVCGALSGAVLMVSANTMAMSTRERVREIGVLKTLGFTRSQVLCILLGESVLIALAGGVLGLGFAAVVVEALRQLPSMFVDLKGLSIPAGLSALSLLLAALVGLGSSLTSAWGAARRPIIESLRFVD